MGFGDPELVTAEPVAPALVPVHGDYFRSNLLPSAGGVAVADWDLLGCGDPAWDLGFLVGAERGLTPTQREEALAAYGPVDAALRARVAWHVGCWQRFWATRS